MVFFHFSTSNEGINVSRVYGLSSFKVSPLITCKILVTVPVKILFDPLRGYMLFQSLYKGCLGRGWGRGQGRGWSRGGDGGGKRGRGGGGAVLEVERRAVL